MKKTITYIALIIGMTSYAQLETISTDYEYDNLNRLVQVVSNGETTRSYTYDDLGNRLDRDTETDDGLTYVPDDAFEQELIDLGYDDVMDDYVPTANIDTVISIDLANLGIQEATGIEDFISLEDLSFSNNNLTEVDLSQNTMLKELELRDNMLMNLDISQNTQLEYLGFQDNQITEIDISNNIALKDLFGSGNLIETLETSNNSLLIKCFMYDNDINTVDFSQNTNLEEIWLHANNLSVIDVSNSSLLQRLELANNSITLLDLSQNSNINHLSVNSNITLRLLNVKNGSNGILNNLFASQCSAIECFIVDNEIAANDGTGVYQSWDVEDEIVFSETCTLGINETTDNGDIIISPNPTSGIIQIEFSDYLIGNDIKYDLIDSSGKKSVTGELESERNLFILDLSKIPSGTYFLVLSNSIGEWTKRIIKL